MIFRSIIEEQDHEFSWSRDDVPTTKIPISSYLPKGTDRQVDLVN